MTNFKSGNIVRMLFDGVYYYGEITIIKEDECKVLFDGDADLNYDYYPKKDLELVIESDLRDD